MVRSAWRTTPIAIADDLLIGTEPIPGTSTYVGVATSRLTVTPDSSVRVAGVVQTRSRAAVACQIQLQSGWPAGRPPALLAIPAIWQSNGAVAVPAAGEEVPRTFEFSGSQLYRVLFPIAALDRAAAQGPRYARAGIEGRDGQHLWGLQARERSAVQRASRILASRDSLRALRPMIRVRWVLRTHDGSALLSTDYVVVSAQIRPYQRVEERGIGHVNVARIGIGQLAGLVQEAQHPAADLAHEELDVFVGDLPCRVERGFGRRDAHVNVPSGHSEWKWTFRRRAESNLRIATTAPALAFAIPCVLASRP